MGSSLSVKKQRNTIADDNMRIGYVDFVAKPPLKIPQEYKVKSPPLGRGPFGELREALHVTLKRRRLIKIVYKTQYSEEELDKVRDEYKILQKLNHPSILKIYENSQDDRYIYIIMEHFKGRELFDKIKHEGPIRDERIAPRILLEILHALKYIHSKNIVYRDLKLENILYNGKQIKLFDFTLAIEPKTRFIKDFIGSLNYIAPEVIRGKYDYRCDIWSFGVVMYMLLTGRAPFTGQSDSEVISKILNGEPNFKGLNINENAQNLIKWILSKKPHKRPSIAEIEEHAYFQQAEIREISDIKLRFSMIYENLRTFRFQSDLQLAIYLFLVRQIGDSVDNKTSIDHIYRLIDHSGQGSITISEFNEFLHNYQIEHSSNEIKELFAGIDLNNTGTIEYYEFIAGAVDRQQLLTERNLKKCFDYFDVGKNGEITIENLNAIFVRVDPAVFQKFLAGCQLTEKGGINSQEFSRIMRLMVDPSNNKKAF